MSLTVAVITGAIIGTALALIKAYWITKYQNKVTHAVPENMAHRASAPKRRYCPKCGCPHLSIGQKGFSIAKSQEIRTTPDYCRINGMGCISEIEKEAYL